MDYFQKFLRPGTQPAPKEVPDYTQEFTKSWNFVKNTLQHPDERQLARGIKSTDVPAHLQTMVNSLVTESTRIDEGTTGGCLEYLLKNDVLGTLVRLSEADRPFGIQAEVLRAVQNMVVLLDEQFLVHSAVHKAVLRLLRNCAGDDLHEQLDGRHKKVLGAAGNAVQTQPSEFEEDLVNLLCILCSRIRTFRELLMIFFHDKHWYRSEPLFSLEEEEEEEEEEDEEEESIANAVAEPPHRPSSPTPSQATVTSMPVYSVTTKKPEYEFLLFNYLLRFGHREGQIGEFARAGLLLLMDVAMSPGEPVHRLTGEETSSEATVDPITDAALALAEYILDGDFSEVLGAGLGAVYSMLPSKLEFRPPTNADRSQETGMVIGSMWLETEDEKEVLEVFRTKSWAMGVEDANSPDFKSRLDHFLKMLEFIQDVLRRNIIQEDVDASSLVGTAIVNSILDAVRRIFLENVLYPTILECSEADGSAVAVMSYIDIMIRTLQDGQLADLLVDFLISEDNEEVRPRPRPQSLMMLNNPPPQSSSAIADKETKSRRRKSSAMALLEIEAPETRKQSEYFTAMARFTLKDLILSNLRSASQPTSTAALQLLQAMLLQHPHLCTDKLLIVVADPLATAFPHPILISSKSGKDENEDEEETFMYPGIREEEKSPISSVPLFHQPDTTFSTHEREMDLYLALVSRVDPSHNSDPFSTGYDNYLRDALFSIQDQPAYQLDDIDGLDTEARQKDKHRINVNDPIISTILESLRRFFSNTPEHNIALTGVLSTLAIHPDRSLAGWLTFASNDSTPSNNDDIDAGLDANSDGDDRSIDYRIEEKLANNDSFLPASSMDEKSRPVVHAIFHGLVAQLERYRRSVNNFDQFLLERRQGLLFSENLSDALTLAIEINENTPRLPPLSDVVQHSKPKPRQSTSSSLVSLFTPKRNKSKSTMAPLPSTPPKKKDTNKTFSESPFAPHYQKTGAIVVEPFVAPVPASSPWTPVKTPRKWNPDEEDVFGAGWSERTPAHTTQDDSDEEESEKKTTTVTLSRLLDNVVILEESIKELVAIIHARRSLGIDSVRYL
ncbi:MAG: Retinoic acid induced 16-like protein-domain-containing protein [Lentinula lateritia]|uniref:Retinoic acid induced 16-like protein-domain-containing protein n=1 Tax=Lentinula lateritia TaxID=40482 RepID=A0ABQ8VIT1_9AGAR|nr:MAG: Retinoic acid induced 16-like protein-domain-containing protein [Lentinula lateritia]KAJ4495545.1 Retinoic acid induced 16-like protein-domain-containing protein [Lentinula lateritia]